MNIKTTQTLIFDAIFVTKKVTSLHYATNLQSLEMKRSDKKDYYINELVMNKERNKEKRLKSIYTTQLMINI